MVTTFTGALNVNADSDEALSSVRATQSMITVGATHSCLLTSKGGVKCWGNNGNGQLGTGTTRDQLSAVAVTRLTSGVAAISAGGSHTCALLRTGALKCWGANDMGKLGTGNTNPSSTPVDVRGMSSGVVSVSAGALHTCAVTAAGAVKCWGRNDFGEVTGTGTGEIRTMPVEVAGLSSGMRAVSAGGNFSCAVTSAGGAKCWGDNRVGYLGDGSTTRRTGAVDVVGVSGAEAITSGGDHTCVLLSSGAAKCWGFNRFGQLGNGATLDSPAPVDVSSGGVTYSAISGGALHTCATTSSGAVQCWGYKKQGQLGLGPVGSTNAQTVPRNVVGITKGATGVAAGQSHACARLSNGNVKCWGDGSGSLLGLGIKARVLSSPVDAVRTGPTSAVLTHATRTTNTVTSVLAAASIKVPARGRATTVVASSSRAVCTLRGTRVSFNKPGRCTMNVTIVSASGKRTKKSVVVQVV